MHVLICIFYRVKFTTLASDKSLASKTLCKCQCKITHTQQDTVSSPELYDRDLDRVRLRLRLTRTGVDGLRESKKSGGGGPIAGSHAGGNKPRKSGGGGNPLKQIG